MQLMTDSRLGLLPLIPEVINVGVFFILPASKSKFKLMLLTESNWEIKLEATVVY